MSKPTSLLAELQERLADAAERHNVPGVSVGIYWKGEEYYACHGVTSVENLMDVTHPEPEAQYHDVVGGDTLSAIAKKFYGDASTYPKIFEANKPMLSDPDKIYPGQKLRIPAQ